MKIESIAAPSIPQPQGATAASPQALSARERAISMLSGQSPVQNPTQVSPEELGAIRVPSEGHKDSIETASTESPKEETKVSEEALSSHYAVLARKEKAIRQREQQLKAREAAAQKQDEAAKAPKAVAFDESKYVERSRLTQDPFTVLNELGLTYDQLTDMAINAPKPEQLAILNEMKALKAEIAALKGETESTKKSFHDSQEQARTQAINNIRNEVKSIVSLDPQFETVKATGNIEEVVKLIEQTYDQDGILLSVEEAAQQVEDYLIDEAVKLARLGKIQRRLQSNQTATQKPTAQVEQPQLKTLTNSIASSRKLSARERAILAFEGKLGK